MPTEYPECKFATVECLTRIRMRFAASDGPACVWEWRRQINVLCAIFHFLYNAVLVRWTSGWNKNYACFTINILRRNLVSDDTL